MLVKFFDGILQKVSNITIFIYNDIITHWSDCEGAITFLSWITTAVVSILAFLTIFLGTHYTGKILEAQKILFNLKNNKLDKTVLVNYLSKYQFYTVEDIAFAKAKKLFETVSIWLQILWGIATFLYIVKNHTGIIYIILMALIYVIFWYILFKLRQIINDMTNVSKEYELPTRENILDYKNSPLYENPNFHIIDLINPTLTIDISNNNLFIILEQSDLWHNYRLFIEGYWNGLRVEIKISVDKNNAKRRFVWSVLDQQIRKNIYEKICQNAGWRIYFPGHDKVWTYYAKIIKNENSYNLILEEEDQYQTPRNKVKVFISENIDNTLCSIYCSTGDKEFRQENLKLIK